MRERIVKIFNELEISSYKVAEDLNNAVSQVTIRNILRGKTQKSHQSTLDLLANYLCENYSVSREWIFTGKGHIYLDGESRLYLEKLGVRFELDELIKHFEENKHEYFSRSKNLMLHVIEELIKNKEQYFELSEYLRLFIKDSVEEKLEIRLNELKELGVIVKSRRIE